VIISIFKPSNTWKLFLIQSSFSAWSGQSCITLNNHCFVVNIFVNSLKFGHFTRWFSSIVQLESSNTFCSFSTFFVLWVFEGNSCWKFVKSKRKFERFSKKFEKSFVMNCGPFEFSLNCDDWKLLDERFSNKLSQKF
jgi:hypothetical protein